MAKIFLILSLVLAAARPATAQGTKPMTLFVEANAIHTLYHELAHALIDQFEIPILGQEEDAADNFATLAMLRAYPGRAEDLLADVAAAWLISAAEAEKLDFYDNHDLDAQRAYRTVCIVYGQDPRRFRDLARWADLPASLHNVCEETAAHVEDSWARALEPAIRNGDGSARVVLRYDPPKRNAVLMQQLRASGLLEAFVADIQAGFAWPQSISVVALSCNQANAFWDPETLRIEFCYEILGEWMAQERRDARADNMFRRTPEPDRLPARNGSKVVRQ